MALSTSNPSGSSLQFVTLGRVPLTELPLRNFIERPPSPIKSYSSPGKIQPTILASPKPKSHSPSPSRPSSIHMDLSSRHQLFREAIRKGDTSSSSTLDDKSSSLEDQPKSIASPKQIKSAAFVRQLSSSSSSSQSLLQKSPSSHTSPSKKASMSAPQSLGKKKERIRRQLLDEDEEGGADVNIRAGSPSPSKMKTQREVALRGPSSSSSTFANQLKEQKKKEVTWTVWQDEELVEKLQPMSSSAVESAEEEEEEEEEEDEDEDKENMKPNFNLNTTGRKKGTGGRLSLLATGDDDEAEQAIDLHDKRRRVTPMDSVI